MDVEIIFKKIYDNIMDLVRRHPESLILQWFESKNLELLSHYGILIDKNAQNDNLKNEILLSDLSWDCDSNKFMTEIGNFLNTIVNLRDKLKRSNLGQEFTPFYIVHQIIQQIKIINNTVTRKKKNLVIIDFAGGTGNFIISILQEEFIKIESNFDFSHSKSRIQNEITKIIDKFHNRLFVLDIDPISCYCITLFSIIIALHFFLRNKINLNHKLLDQLPLITVLQVNFLKLHKFYPDLKADIILGNPPYIFSRDLESDLKRYLKIEKYHTVKGQYDLSDVFLEQSLKLLKLEGILSVIIPETLLFLENRKVLRKLIVKNSQTIKIIPTENVFEGVSVENILLFCKKNTSPENESIEIIWEENTAETLIKSDLLEDPNVYLIKYDPITIEIINWLKKNFLSINEWNRINSDDKIEIFRGVELSKHGRIMRCNHCSKWMPFSRKRLLCSHCKKELSIKREVINIISEKTNANSENVVNFIQNMSLNEINAKATSQIKLNFVGINYKDISKYRKKRIIVRQILAQNKICAAISPENALNSQSIYNIILSKKLEPYIIELTQILRTDIISYFNYMTFSRGKRLFSRILLNKLKDLPWIPRNLNFKNISNISNNFKSEIEKVISS
ncbi:Eco57I restriction-modification methylase domain-containing protein [Promethearchaeum syntrophicum]|uniref:site-specific DNA-methyltransferase (adenine-specific) n=1 Tax=Promethearchaeum syntrophicum TaxID=2594042 RepID=A0A5B9DEU2_9ARCH|nr:Eco57I restriction-modification methylase domain-containing protein [Candidatus Prometheoarchaeum syntrophicum]QEE17622.1 Eco57I restriction-modification methylase [Candidatus Prometheoarchaeum syntrophicum]